MFHVTQRLLLRPFWREDWASVLEGIADEAIVRNLARAPWPYDETAARAFVGMEQDPRLPHFALIESCSGRMIGSAGFGDCDGEAEIGYWLARQAWGRGYAVEAAGALVAMAPLLGHRRLVAGHFVDNPASGKVLRKVGFRPTGHLHMRHSLARGEDVSLIEFSLDLDQVDIRPPLAA